MRWRLTVLHIAVSVLIAYLYVSLGIGRAYFWHFAWWDSVLHFLGGLWAALILAWFQTLHPRPFRIIHYALVGLAIGIAWEVLEYVGDFPRSPHLSYGLDTAKDLVLDTLGGAFAYICVRIART